MYLRVLTDYFVDPDFFKPTGDGLMLVYVHDEATLQPVASLAVDRAVRLVVDFPSLLEGEPMLNFETPRRLGIGIARGPATKLVSQDRTLDYSGRPLNLAARLMDFARPSGVVLDGQFVAGAIEESVLEGFSQDKIYIKESRSIHRPAGWLNSAWTTIRDEARRPIGVFEWVLEEEKVPLSVLAERGAEFQHGLTRTPAFPDEIAIKITHDSILPNGEQHPTMNTFESFPAQFRRRCWRTRCVL